MTNTVVWHIDEEDLDISVEFMLRLVEQGNKWLIWKARLRSGFFDRGRGSGDFGEAVTTDEENANA